MSLEKLLAPFKFLKENAWDFLDEELQIFYTKVGQRIPDNKLHSFTTLTSLLSFPGVALSGLYFVDSYPRFAAVFWPTPTLLIAPDLFLNMTDKHRQGVTAGELVVEEPIVGVVRSYIKLVRLPTFLPGIGFGVKAICDVGSALFNGEPVNWYDSFSAAYHSLSFLGLASSMYLKDQDPKLLERKKQEERARALVPVYDNS